MPFGPKYQVAKLLNLGMLYRRVIRQRQSAWMEDCRLGAQELQESGCFITQHAAEGALAIFSVQQQDAGLVLKLCRRGELIDSRDVEQRFVQVGVGFESVVH